MTDEPAPLAEQPSPEACEAAKDIREELMRMVFMGTERLVLPAGALSVMAKRLDRFAAERVATLGAAQPMLAVVEAARQLCADQRWVLGVADPHKGSGNRLADALAAYDAAPTKPALEAARWRPSEADIERAVVVAIKGEFTRRGYVWPPQRGPHGPPTAEDVARAAINAALPAPPATTETVPNGDGHPVALASSGSIGPNTETARARVSRYGPPGIGAGGPEPTASRS